MSLLQVTGIGLEEEGNAVLKDISFTQNKLQKIAIAGETGSGKSTLLQVIAGLAEPATGEVFFQNKRVIGPVEKLVPGHPHIAYLSQQFELPQFLRVEQVLKYANTLSAGEAEALFELCHISHLFKRRTDRLSGGERQRIALARLLIGRPKLLLLDEPFSNLDMGHKNLLKTIIRDIGEKLEITCILISHDPLDTLSWADEIFILQAGRIIQKGSPQQVYRQPVNEYAAALLGNYNLLKGTEAKAIAGLAGIRMNGKQLLVRPESFKIVPEESQQFSGKVNKVHYFGSYYEVEVKLSKTTITVRTPASEHVKGDTVYLALSPEAIWFI